MPEKILLTAKEVCQWLHISQFSLDKWVSEWRFPEPFRTAFGGWRRWDRREIEQWLEEGKIQR